MKLITGITSEVEKEMKSIIYFIGLKIAEIGGTFLVYYLLCVLYAELLFKITPDGKDFSFWIGGMVSIFYIIPIGAACIMIIGASYKLITANWNLAKRLSKK